MAKTLAIIFGVILVILGLLGFVGNPLIGSGALFEADMGYALMNLVGGLVLLAVAFFATGQSMLWLKIVGVIYVIVALLGFFLGTPVLGFIGTNSAGNWLNLIIGIVLVTAGYMGKGSMGGGAGSMGGGMGQSMGSSGQQM
ncbi:hypothetical protein A3H77_00950 [Candidatus Kaiserbacteria bacterium RIFCSPLOWO2_02_FULL_56_11]|uniref:DUF4383 domain-containing protein n=2 Tax=Candidatus Kaiseribacteriota TaxID=1752734 RepID=A0A1F6E288_9BACT|nr:MAG: hypothetical protein A3C95_00965 [Candidatus Kaiserbacteria bacterium RIFCSPHIGHO2_02_FULL_56_30]OGG72432.1 MAG: hypothetical protein A3E65_02865 [Candidatus Kaiserbacteria bacterium RIFCSPHIGHO2_12_FULL_56_13]OGG82301.1 MAG: hypothetical protein A3H77_00950 [Candidatus Kaiserbacteria bacterium RIFCSPLOWO2_02_FULL_56_11]